jgi:DnaJ domain
MREPGPDPYRVLGVSRDATATDITRAYRRLARAAHPDTAPPGAGATARFRAVSEAYQVLSNPARRAEYDRPPSRQAAPGHGQAAPGRARPRPGARMPPTMAQAMVSPDPVPMPALWAGPVRVEPLPAPPVSGPKANSLAGVAAWAGPVRWHPGARRDGLW